MIDQGWTLNTRVARLERLNRILITVVVGMVLLGLVAAVGPGEIVRAGAFRLVDEDGRVRAELALRDGTVGLFLKDGEGRDRLLATHDSEGTGLFLNDTEGASRVGVAQWAHGGGGVALHGPETKGAVVLYFKEQGSLRFFDSEGKVTNEVLASRGPQPAGG